MNKVLALGGGLAGAGALTLVHEVSRRISPDSPRMDLLGMNALAKVLRKANGVVPSEGTLFGISLAGDLVSNALYYSLAGANSPRSVWVKGALLGLAAGLGAIYLPQEAGLSDKYTNSSKQTRALTLAIYIVGGLVAAATINMFRGKSSKATTFLKSQKKKSFFGR